MSPRDANEVEQQRQRDAMLNRGADHNEIHNPNKVSDFNATGKVTHERKSQEKKDV